MCTKNSAKLGFSFDIGKCFVVYFAKLLIYSVLNACTFATPEMFIHKIFAIPKMFIHKIFSIPEMFIRVGCAMRWRV